MQSKLLLYDTFNAKYLSYKDVAESFVPNDEYFQILRNNSIILMGSRGCGKTTLLKMLTPAGLNYWKGKEAEQFKESNQFTAVYIPSDIQWKNQFDYLSEHLSEQDELIEIITQFLFTSNILIALCRTFRSYIDFSILEPKQKIILEFEVGKILKEGWDIENEVLPTFDDIELKILTRVNFLNSLVKKSIFSQKRIISNEIPKYVFSDFFDLVKIGIKVFEQKAEIPSDHKWALCFDELEIVPKFIQLKLISFLRSVDQKYIFKLTTTPLFNMENNIIEASQGNDFSTIKLWVYDETGLKKWRKFCEKLLFTRLESLHDIKKNDFKRLFGHYNLDEIIREEFNDFRNSGKNLTQFDGSFSSGLGKGSSMYFLFKYLAETDTSFFDFLKKRNINPNNPYTSDKILQKSVFLKYKVDAVYRMIYRKRTRRTPPIHFGFPYIFDICDGNPRLVIGLIDEILQKSKVNLKEKNSVIDKKIQSQIIYNASEKYFNLLKNHPDSTITLQNNDFNLANNLIKVIGEFMHNKLIQDEFSKSAPSTFRIDEDINHKFIGLLETALYLGAIVYLDPIESLSNKGIVGKRFRLSSFLTPHFKIPSRNNSEVRLSTILKLDKNKHQTKLDYNAND